jgi:hypothetical protein
MVLERFRYPRLGGTAYTDEKGNSRIPNCSNGGAIMGLSNNGKIKNSGEVIADQDAEDQEEKLRRWQENTIMDMFLPIREYHILTRAGCETVADVVAAGQRKIRTQRNCGKKSFAGIMKKLAEYDVDLTEWHHWILNLQHKYLSCCRHLLCKDKFPDLQMENLLS